MRRAFVIALTCASCRFGFEGERADAGRDAAPGVFTIGGVVAGLAGTGLTLENNGGDPLEIGVDGPFTFATPIGDGLGYDVTVASPPSGQTCIVANGSGIVAGTAITDVSLTCFADGACPATPITLVANQTFTMPAGCSAMIVAASGGGGAGGAKNAGDAAAAGGTGGLAVRTFTGVVSGTQFVIAIGGGGLCASTASVTGGYGGGAGGTDGGSGNGAPGAGASAPPGGLGGAGSSGAQPGGSGGNGGYGGGGGGGGGDKELGNSGGGATVFALAVPATDYVIAGGGGGAGTADQNGDVSGDGGAACTGYGGADGGPAIAGTRSGGGGGGGACTCLGGACDTAPTSSGGSGGTAGTSGGCSSAQNGASGSVVITFL